jgi:hypothetical protein
MGKPDRPVRRDTTSDPAQGVLIEVTALPGPGAPRFSQLLPGLARPRSYAFGLLALLLASVALVIATGHGHRIAQPRSASALAREKGPAGVAAAYGFPLRCLAVTILPVNRTYARADFNHRSPCGHYAGYPTAIFRYAGGRWHPVLDALGYRCPVRALPVEVQTRLGVCLQPSS